MKTRGLSVGLLTIFVHAVCAAPAWATVPPTPAGPSATIISSHWSIGDKMIVRGEGWPQGKVSVQVCGNAAVNGTADCDGPGTRGFGVGSSLKFAGKIVVGAPPAPCPCVVLVGSNFHDQTVLIPITIKDHPLLDEAPSVDPNEGLTTLSLTSSFVKGDWWRDALGVSPVRIMTVTITNTGGKPTGAGVVDITVGKDTPPTGFAASISFDSIDPGESTSVAAKFAVDSFAYGTYNMTARVTTPAAGGEITEQTSTFPGYLLVALITIILIVDLIWMAKVRKRRHMFATAEAAAAAAAAAEGVEAERANAAALAAATAAAATLAAQTDAEEVAARDAHEALIALLASDQDATPFDASASSPSPPSDPEVAPAAPASSGETDAPGPDQKSATIDDFFDSLLGDRP